jgi:magnesium-transporting ATPase (P-type)
LFAAGSVKVRLSHHALRILSADHEMKSSPATPQAIEKPHALPGDEVLQKLDSTPEGLSAAEAAKRLEAIGPNRLPEPPKEGLLKRFFKHFHDLLIYILIAAAGVTAALGHWGIGWIPA